MISRSIKTIIRLQSTTITNPLDPSLRLFPLTELCRTHQTPTSPTQSNPSSTKFTQTDTHYILSVPLSDVQEEQGRARQEASLSIHKDFTLRLYNSSFLVLSGPHFRREFSVAHPIAARDISCHLRQGQRHSDREDCGEINIMVARESSLERQVEEIPVEIETSI